MELIRRRSLGMYIYANPISTQQKKYNEAILAKIYLKYRNLSLLQDILKSLRPAVIAMIAAAGVSILVTAFWGNDISSLHLDAILSSTNIRAVGIFLLSLILLAKFKMDPIHVMLLSGGAEVVMQLIMKLL